MFFLLYSPPLSIGAHALWIPFTPSVSMEVKWKISHTDRIKGMTAFFFSTARPVTTINQPIISLIILLGSTMTPFPKSLGNELYLSFFIF